jgi:hypothetical protein
MLSTLDLGPSWARDVVPRPVKSPVSRIAAAEEEASMVRERQGAGRGERRDGGGRGFSRDEKRGPRRDGRNERREPEYREREVEILPAPGIRCSVQPNLDAIHLIAKEVVHVARVYSLFDIAKTLMSQRERFHGIFTAEANREPMYHGHRDNSLWLTKEECVRHFWSADWRGDLYEEEEVEIEGPQGNFQVVAKCGLSGYVFGPPNYHAYQTSIRQVHREKFANMPFDRYAAKIVTERSEEAVQAWLHGMKTKKRWRPVGQEESAWLEDKAEVERHFLGNRFPEMYVATHQVEIPAHTKGHLFSPSLLAHLKKSAGHAANHPLILIPTICNLLEKEHLPVFKKQGKLFAGPSRPHPIPENTTFSERPAKIVEWMSANPETKLAALWEAVLPEGEKDPSAEWLGDLFWLLSQGHLLLFPNDVLVMPTRRKAEPQPAKPAKEKAAAAKKAKNKKPKKPRKHRRSRLLAIYQRVEEMPVRERLSLRGYERTVSHRIRLKAAYSKQRALARSGEDADDVI